eukprot:GHRR01010500.1.p1 GENE.GHRR01010500.1~~GHRR01010500.1.p1  ORF type:complete len:609 (+),score=239.62 GHRR01010500.1:462-2288(+)
MHQASTNEVNGCARVGSCHKRNSSSPFSQHPSKKHISIAAPPAAAWLPGHSCNPKSLLTAAAADADGNGSSNNIGAQQNGQSSAAAAGREYDYDVFVIGGGSGGVRTARTAAAHGRRVALVELPLDFMSSADKGGVGGTCVLRGCVPKKLMLYASEFASEAKAGKGFGWVDGTAGTLDWQYFLKVKREELLRLNKVYKNNLTKSGVELLEGRGKVLGPNEVVVDGKSYTTGNIVIATGGQSSRIPIPGAEHAIVSDKVLELDSIPKVVTLIGGGYIGMEFAGMFARLGCEVHVVARQELPLVPRFDLEVCRFFMEQCSGASGIHMHMRSNPTEIVKEADGTFTVKLEPIKKDKDNKDKGISADASGNAAGVTEIRGNQQVVLATGRSAKTKGLGLEEVGVEMGLKGSVKVNEYSQTNIPSIWAVGDVTSRMALTPVAIMEGQALGQTLATGEKVAPCYDAVPSSCFSWPFVGTVGLTEEQVKDKGMSFEVYTSTFTPLKATLAAGGLPDNIIQKGFAKMLVELGTGRLLGIHMVGEDAPEIVQGYALALKLGVTKQQLDSVVGVHPTAAEELVGMKGPARVVKAEENKDKKQQQSQAEPPMGSAQKAR